MNLHSVVKVRSPAVSWTFVISIVCVCVLLFLCALAHSVFFLFLCECVITSLHLNHVIWFRMGVTGRARHFLPLFEAEVYVSQSVGWTCSTNQRSLCFQRAQMKRCLTSLREWWFPHILLGNDTSVEMGLLVVWVMWVLFCFTVDKQIPVLVFVWMQVLFK